MGGVDQLRVRVLGGLDVDGIDSRALGSRKARTLVKVLALNRGRPVPGDRVIEALWPGDDAPARPLEQVGVLVSRLRSVLGAERVTRSDAGWALAVDWLDVDEFEARVDEAAARLASGQPAAAKAAARAALALIRGEFLADEPDALWAESDRLAVARSIARVRLVAAEAALATGDAGEAASVAEGALDHDPYDEAALRLLMRAHTSAGRPASALAAYAHVRERLAEDLGVAPARETEELHTAILLGEPARPASATGALASAAVVGRDAELAELDRLLAETECGDANLVVVVEGEPGIGKTALLRGWRARVGDRALVLSGGSDEHGRDLPLQPVLDGLANHLRRLGADADAVVGDTAPVLGHLLGQSTRSSEVGGPTTVADPSVGQALVFGSLLAVVERAAGDRPVVLIVEDVHLAGSSTIEWLRFAYRRGRRMLVVTSKRSGTRVDVGTAHVILLGPLDLPAVSELVGADRASEIHARSGGHPLFLIELAAARPGELPASIRESVARRVDGLGEAAATLRTAAVLGAELDIDLLAGVMRLSVAVLLEHVEAGIGALVIEERLAVLAFRHELLREALLADTTAARRAFVHREAAGALRSRPRHDPLQVAWHARLGGDVDAASAALVEAAAVATERFDAAAGEALLTEAIELVDAVGARLARARVRIARWQLDGADADVARGLELGAAAVGLEVAAWVAYYRRDYELARRYAEEAIERSDDDGLRASCLAMTGRVLHASGHLREAEPCLEQSVKIAPTTVRGFAQVWLAGLRVHQGRPEEAAELVDRGMVDRRWLGHPFAVHHAALFRILSLGQQGRPVEALLAADEATAAARSAGEQGERFVAVADNVRSWALRGVGLVEEGDEASHRALELTSAEYVGSMSEMRVASLLDLLEGRILTGDLDGIAVSLDRAAVTTTMQGSMAWHHRQRYGVQQARVALMRGDPARAAELVAEVIADAGSRGSGRYGPLAAAVAARAALAQGETIEHDDLDRVLAELDRCAGLEAWRVTAELAAAAGVDRWWRDAERRAGGLIANAGVHGESLRRHVASTFTALGR